MLNIKNSEEYDNYLISYVQSYTVTKFVGRGKYEKTHFLSIEEAKRYERILKEIEPDARIMLYGICKPPHTNLIVSVAIGKNN